VGMIRDFALFVGLPGKRAAPAAMVSRSRSEVSPGKRESLPTDGSAA
jgi:hypothetical protein